MDQEKDRHEAHEEEATDRKAEEARKELDEIPEPGTDPLHEGP